MMRRAADGMLPLASLLVAGSLVWWTRALPSPRSQSLGWIFASAANQVLFAFLATAATMMGLGRVLGQKESSGAFTIRTAAVGVWFVPLVVLASQNSSWAMAAAVALASSITLLIRFQLRVTSTAGQPMLAAMCASLALQTAFVSGIAGRAISASTLAGISAAILAWRFTAVDLPRAPSRWGSVRHALLATLAAIFLTVFGMLPYWKRPPVQAAAVSGRGHAQPRTSPSDDSQANLGGDYRGVILWPKSQPQTMLVAPLPALGRGLVTRGRPMPLSFPFIGAYWFYRAPDRRPPPGSHVFRGSPAETTYRSTDYTPLLMEARQNFGNFIALSCCRSIQLAVTSADRYPATVTVELILIHSTLPGKPILSLGRVPVKSTPRWQPVDTGGSRPELLTFPIPATAILPEFDEVVIRFHLQRPRADRSARISIDKFVFVPRSY